jgi:branched-chain amino acid transport system ATP-binding protein
MLDVNKINVLQGRVHVLKDISFGIKEKEICSVVGANGAGKSTLINSISRILPLKSGSIQFRGQDVSRFPPHSVVELGLIQIPEGRRLFRSLTVLENLEMGGYQGEAKLRRNETTQEVFSLFPILKERKHQHAETLSGGEQQMLAIGRGLMCLPKLLMLDEPSLGLAPIVVKAMFDVIEKINKTGMTILLVEQNARKSLSISNRGFVLENGSIAMSGDAKEIANNEHTKKAYLGL